MLKVQARLHLPERSIFAIFMQVKTTSANITLARRAGNHSDKRFQTTFHSDKRFVRSIRFPPLSKFLLRRKLSLGLLSRSRQLFWVCRSIVVVVRARRHSHQCLHVHIVMYWRLSITVYSIKQTTNLFVNKIAGVCVENLFNGGALLH